VPDVPRFEELLAVQELDTRLDQLGHQRVALPQIALRREVGDRIASIGASMEQTEAALRSIRSTQREAEDHAVLLGDKWKEIQDSLYDGSVTSHKELESLQEEMVNLTARREAYEDQALEQMELAEPLEEELARLEAARVEAQGSLEQVEAELTVATAELDVQIERVAAERSELAADVDDELLLLYDSLRAGLGVAVARLSGSRCEGCHLEIPSAQLEGVRRAPADEVVSCPECGRILVR
jgi:uncharacterized protein